MLDLCELPQLTYFYPLTFTLECPALNELGVSECHELELFQSAHPEVQGEVRGSSSNRLPLISNLKVISNLKELTLDWKHISALSSRFRSEQFVEGLNYLEKIVLLFDSENERPMLPIEIILQKAPNLIDMSINCGKSPEIFLTENPENSEDRMLRQLKILTLWNVSKLQTIELEDSSWLNTICENLHELYVEKCLNLTKLVYTVSFSCLRKVSIFKCLKVEYLFTSSTAKQLMNLEEISVEDCESVEEIVAIEGDEISDVIKFERLHTIVLDNLPSLICFYQGDDALQLSSLITVHISECRKMEIFSEGVIYAESFQGIQMSSDPKQDLLFHQDLNATIKLMSNLELFEAVNTDCDNLELQASLLGDVGLQNKWLGNLVSLTLYRCTLLYAIPSHILPHLMNLKTMQVFNSNIVELIFDMKETEIMQTRFQLKRLILNGLSQLKRLWQKNSQGVLIFPDLQDVWVDTCPSLETLFPASMAKNLGELEILQIKSCCKLQEIVEKEEGVEANVTEKFVFPLLKVLDLRHLTQVTDFYPQTFTLECPALESLYVSGCRGLELLQSALPVDEGEGSSTSINRRPLISNLKVFSNLKRLKLHWKHISALSLRLRSGKFTEGFQYLEYIDLSFLDADKNDKPILPLEIILQKAPNLIEMHIDNCNVPEILLAHNPKIGEDRMLGQLEIFTLFKVSDLQSIESEDMPWLNTNYEKLQVLTVIDCSHLTALVHTVSFSCLKRLDIRNYANLQYLFTSSAAKKLLNLEDIFVRNCKSLKEIVVKEGDDDEHKGKGEDKYENEMIFRKLDNVLLDSLPEFESFYMGNFTLNFPSLKYLTSNKWNRTKFFCLGDRVRTDLMVKVDGVRWEGDINPAIMQEEAA